MNTLSGMVLHCRAIAVGIMRTSSPGKAAAYSFHGFSGHPTNTRQRSAHKLHFAGLAVVVLILVYPLAAWSQGVPRGDVTCADRWGGRVVSCSSSGGSSSSGDYQGPNLWRALGTLLDSGPSAAEQARQQRIDEAHTANEQGLQAYKNSDWARAVTAVQEAATKNPDNLTIRNNLAAAQERLANAQAELQMQRQARASAERMQQSIQSLAQSLNATPISGGLDFDSNAPTQSSAKPTAALEFGDLTTGEAFGSKRSNPTLTPAEVKRVGNNTNAGDQLKSAAAEAAKGSKSNLTINYDVGGAANAGPLVAAHSRGTGAPPMDLSLFSDRARNDPKIVASLKDLSELQSKRIELEAQRTQLTKERNQAKTPAAMQKKSDELVMKDEAYQANLVAITKKTEAIEKQRRFIDNSPVDSADTTNNTTKMSTK